MRPSLVLRVLLQPELAADLDPQAWDLLVRQARRANLLSRLATVLEPQLDALPTGPRRHLKAALQVARRQVQTTRWEVQCVRDALAPESIEPILLKGAAYLVCGLAASQGRLFGDVDILVPRRCLDAAEAALLQQGWEFPPDISAYDQRYYREWMHEIPPLGHAQRGTSLDLHHSILPPTARMPVNTAALFDDTLAVPGMPGVRVLGPVTMFLHSAAHLFHEGELGNGLRDLFDLDALLREFGRDPAFWSRLIPRAQALGLTRPLFYALRCTRRLLDTPVPQGVVAEVAAMAAPGAWALRWMDFCWDRGLAPAHASCDDAWTPGVRLFLYVRAHWLRMPALLLARHLLRKAWLRLLPKPEPVAPA